MTKKETIIIALLAVVLVSGTVGAAVYISQDNKAPVKQVSSSTSTKTVVQAQPRPAGCNDGNIAGKALGGVGGGIAGSMVGKGHGKTAATIGGTLGGAYVGGEVIPLQNVTCPK